MNAASPSLTENLRREIQYFRLAMILLLIALFIYNTWNASPSLSKTELTLYVVSSLVLIGIYTLSMFAPANAQTMVRVAAFVLIQVLLVVVIAFLIKGKVIFYIYLTAFDGYAGLRSVSKDWRVPMLYLLGIVALTGFAFQHFETLTAFWNALPIFIIMAFAAEFVNRQWEHRTQLDRLLTELSQAHAQLRDYVDQAEALAVLQERGRLAHEIHDMLGHSLTALDVQMELLTRLPGAEVQKRQQAAKQARLLTKESLRDLRRAVQALQPSELETLSLPEAIEQLTATFVQNTSIAVSNHIQGKAHPLSAQYSLLLFRATQESLTNIQRHAPHTPRVDVELNFGTESVQLVVKNTRDEVTAGMERNEGRYGLRGLAERTAAFGGEFEAGNTSDGGFQVKVSLPFDTHP